MVTDMEDIDSDNEESVMPLLFYPECSNDEEEDPRESLRYPTSS